MKKAWNYFRKHHLYFFLPLMILSATLGPALSLNLISFTFIIIYSFSYYFDSPLIRTNIGERKLMARKGLTYRQWRNINFLKKWSETRTAGPIKYIFVFGGLYSGFGLCFAFCYWMLKYEQRAIEFTRQSLGNMLILIGYCYLAGFLIAGGLHTILWLLSERKFARLNALAH
jgi:hypothetical protein